MVIAATTRVTVRTPGRGLVEITGQVADAVRDARLRTGVCTVFACHTSCGIIIQENADPSARRDLEAWLDRHVPDDDPAHTHRDEGPDDMPAHIRAVLTGVSVSIPVIQGSLALGTWQGIYLWEHRLAGRARTVAIASTGC